MEALLVLLAIAIVLGPWILAIAAMVRAGRLARRVALLENRLDLRAAAPRAVEPGAIEPRAVEPERPLETVLAAPPVRPLAPPPSPADAGEREDRTPPAPRVAAPAAPPGSLEERIALVWLTRAGALVVLLGAATFFKWAVDNEWIGPTGRVALGVLAGVAAIAAGEVLRARTRALWVNVVQGAGVALLFFSAFAAAALYALIPPMPAFAAVLVIAAAGCALSLRGRSEVVLALSVAGGLLAPVLLSTGTDNPAGLLGWLLLVSGAALVVSARLGFRWVPWLALAGTSLLFVAWHDRFFHVWPPPEVLDPDLPPEAQAGAYFGVRPRIAPLALVVVHVASWLAFWWKVRRPAPLAADGEPAQAPWPRLLGDVWLGAGILALHAGPFALVYDHPLAVGAVVALAGLAAAELAARAARPAFHPIAAVLGGLLLAAATEHGWASIAAAAIWAIAHLVAAGRTLLAAEAPAGEQARPGLTASAAVIASSVAGLGFAGLAIAATGPEQELLRAALAGAAGAAELALGAATLPRGRTRATVLLGSALGLVAAAAGFLLSGASITFAWAALAAAVAVVAARERDRYWLAGAIAMFALALGRALSVDLVAPEAARQLFLSTDGVAGVLSPRFLLNARGGGLAGLAIALLVAARAVARAAAADAPRAWRVVAGLLATAGHAVLLALCVAEARDLVVQLPPPPPAGDALAFEEFRSTVWDTLSSQAGVRDTTTTVVLGLYASVLLVAGFVAREVLHRWLGLALFAITLVKVLFSDVWRLGSGLRILVFMASGLLMLAAGFLYARYGKRILGLADGPPPGAGVVALLLAAGLAAAPGLARAQAAQALDAAPFATERPVEGITSPGLHAVRVDAALWQASDAGAGALDDVRVAGPDGAEVAWALRGVGGPHLEEEVPVTVLDPVVLPGGAVRAVLDRERPGLRTDELRLDLQGDDFLRRVRVETSGDGRRWGVLVDGPRVYAVPGLEGLEPARRSTVLHPPTEARWLRVTLLAGAGAPPRVLGARTVRRPVVAPPVDVLSLAAPARVADPQRRLSRFDLDLGGAGIPFEAVVLGVRTPAFERRVRVLGSEDARTWVGLGDGLVFRVPGDEALRVDVRAAGRRHLRLEVLDGDAPPLELATVTVEWPARELVLDARRAGAHRLLAGAARQRAPAYDLPGVLARSPDAAVAAATLGPARPNPAYHPVEAQAPFTERHRVALGAGLALVLAGLAAFTVKLMRSSGGAGA